MKKIKISKGYEVLVDDEDYVKLNLHSWHAATSKPYAARSLKVPKRKMIYMHREIMQPSENMIIDHINGNTLDNRKQNLRICKKGNNQFNKTKSVSKKYTKYKGVFRQKDSSTWYAELTVCGEKHKLIGFKTDKDAAIGYNKLALTYFGEYAKLNIVEQND